MATVLQEVSLKEEDLSVIITNTKEYAQLHGILIRTKETPDSSELVHYAPFALFPSCVPRQQLEAITSVQSHFSRLMHLVAHDRDFLYKCLENVLEVDEFNRRLWNISKIIEKEGTAQPVCLGLFRNDYMMDVKNSTNLSNTAAVPDNIQMKEIEFNMIAASFGGLVSPLCKVHRYSLSQAGKDFNDSQIPPNDPALGLARGLVKAWEIYGNTSAYVLFLVQRPEQNTMDQRWLDCKMFECNRSVKVIYRTLADVASRGCLSQDKKLMMDGCEIAVIYMRAGYAPQDLPTEKEWDARLLMERSTAIKCPTVNYQLAGTKKVQQELCRKGAVEKYISDPDVLACIRATFAEQYSLDLGPDGDEAVSKALTSPNDFVLKPNREGGGNNTYGNDIKIVLNKLKDSSERAAYILMERIYPWVQKNVLIKSGVQPQLHKVVNEVGIYGVLIGNKDKILYNESAGHLVRTKTLDTDEGGIMTGFSCLDTPFLLD